MKKPASLSSIQYGGRDKGKTASRKTGTEAEARYREGVEFYEQQKKMKAINIWRSVLDFLPEYGTVETDLKGTAALLRAEDAFESQRFGESRKL